MTTVAALYVDPAGVYANLPGVEVWDEARDARTYAGPWPVVAHPPCNRWSIMAQCNPHVRHLRGEDAGCFAAALDAVRTFGGVLEHPAHSLAWKRYGLPRPSTRGGWTGSLIDDGASCMVDQAAYGHQARKPTWLYAVACELPSLDWGGWQRGEWSVRASGRSWSSYTPPAFRDVLLAMARSAARPPLDKRRAEHLGSAP